MAATLDAEIDRLYQLLPEAFTAARNVLAKGAGARSAEIKRLQKPNSAAWAVNQLYWRDRTTFDRLARASADLRAAHVRQVSGRAVDRAAAEARHRAAFAEARRRVSAYLEEASLHAPAALAAVERTLEAVPDARIAGRLTRPIDPVGFALLADLMDAADRARSASTLADVTLHRTPAAGGARATPASRQTSATALRREAADARRAAAAQREAIRQLDLAVRAAAASERDATIAFDKARQAVARADARVASLDAKLRAARETASRLRDDLERARASANDAAAARIQAERRRASDALAVQRDMRPSSKVKGTRRRD